MNGKTTFKRNLTLTPKITEDNESILQVVLVSRKIYNQRSPGGHTLGSFSSGTLLSRCF